MLCILEKNDKFFKVTLRSSIRVDKAEAHVIRLPAFAQNAVCGFHTAGKVFGILRGGIVIGMAVPCEGDDSCVFVGDTKVCVFCAVRGVDAETELRFKVLRTGDIDEW